LAGPMGLLFILSYGKPAKCPSDTGLEIMSDDNS